MAKEALWESQTLAIGPANYAGQAYEWAEAVRCHCRVDADSFAFAAQPGSGAFGFPVHQVLGERSWTRPWRPAGRFDALVATKSHVLVDGFESLSGLPRIWSLRRDLTKLMRRGISVGLISHGSDTRDPDAHMKRNEFSYFRYCPEAFVDRLRTISSRNRALALGLDVPTYVSTPDLLLDNPQAEWLPLTTRFSSAVIAPSDFAAKTLTVLHIPSWREPQIKGTGFVDPVLRDLDSQGLIRYLSPPRVKHSEMPSLLAEADVVVDQIMTGSYGVGAIEAMAAGRLVVGYVSEETRALMPAAPPIVNASPAIFSQVMLEIVDDPARFGRLAAEGPAFVAKLHNGSESAKVLTRFLAQRLGHVSLEH